MKLHLLFLGLLLSAPCLADNAASITHSELKDHVGYLADDALEGRGTGTKGERLAGEYIAKELESYGLEGGSAEGTWFQSFQVAGRPSLVGTPKLKIDVGQWYRDLKQGRDFNPFGFSGDFSGTVPLVFAGYGITDPESGYDDYEGLDVKGKAVLVLRHQPNEGKGPMGRGAIFTTKAANAKAHGAVAMIVVTDPLNHPKDDSVLPFRGSGDGDAGIAAVHVRKSLIEGLLRLAGQDLAKLQSKIDESGKPHSLPLKGKITLELKIQRSSITARNVIGKLQGTDPTLSEEVVVIGAHYDHLGKGGHGGSLAPGSNGTIHNGADDNASGTAGLLELAQAFAANRPRRTIYFVGFSGEERGLLGSAHFVKNAPIAVERIAAMINLDMIGRLTKDTVEVGGAGTAPGFEKLILEATRAEGLETRLNPSGFGPSDHASFYAAKIPVLFFFTGLHEDYHRPTDDTHLLNAEGAQKVARAAFHCAEAIANADARPTYVNVPRGRRGARGGNRPYLGVVTTSSPVGLGVAEVVGGSPAAKAGLKTGDAITRFDGKDVKSLNDLRGALRGHKPGDEVEVVIMRAGESKTLKLKLGGR